MGFSVLRRADADVAEFSGGSTTSNRALEVVHRRRRRVPLRPACTTGGGTSRRNARGAGDAPPTIDSAVAGSKNDPDVDAACHPATRARTVEAGAALQPPRRVALAIGTRLAAAG